MNPNRQQIDDEKRRLTEEWINEKGSEYHAYAFTDGFNACFELMKNREKLLIQGQTSLQQRVDEIAQDLSNVLLKEVGPKQFIADDLQKLSSAGQTLIKWQDSVCTQKPKPKEEPE